MIDLYAAAQALAAHLESAEISAVLSAADLVPPAVWIQPPTVWRRYGAGADVQWPLLAVAQDSGRGPAIADLSTLLDKLAAALPGQWSDAVPTDVATSDGTLPGYRLQITQRLEETTP